MSTAIICPDCTRWRSEYDKLEKERDLLQEFKTLYGMGYDLKSLDQMRSERDAYSQKCCENNVTIARLESALRDIASVTKKDAEDNPDHWIRMCVGRAAEALENVSRENT